MDSTARFLLGGALGAALGYLVSQKNLEKALKGPQPSTLPVGSQDMDVDSPAVQAPAAGVTESPPPVVVSTPEPRLEADLLQSVAPAVPVAEAPPVSAPPWRPIPRTAPETKAEPPAASAEAPSVALPEPDIIVTRELLDEPLPSSGWESEASAGLAEQSIEQMAPSAPDVIRPYAGPEIERFSAETPADEPAAVSLEEVVEEPVPEEVFTEEPPAEERMVEELLAGMPVVEDQTAEGPVVEMPVIEEPAVEEPVSAEALGASPVVEERMIEELLAQMAAVEPPPAVVAPPGPAVPTEEAPVADVVTGEESGGVAEAGTVESPPVELVSIEEPTAEPGGNEELLAEISGPGTTEIETLVETAQFGRPLAPVEDGEEVTILAEQPANEPLVIEGVAEEALAGGSTHIEALVETASVEAGAGGALMAKLPAAQATPAAAEAEVEVPVVEEVEVELPVEVEMAELPVVAEAEAEMQTAESAPVAGTEPALETARAAEALPVVEEMVVDLPAAEETTAEMLVIEEAVAEEAATAVPVVETTSTAQAPVVEAGPVSTATAQSETARVNDLKARIEETRRRIRQELEQPFVATEESPPAEDDWTISSVVPTPTAGPVVGEPASAEPEVLALDDVAEVVDAGMVVDLDEPVDYESMKSRIEVTRSRLKAKAFDAMMMGESALLGRDAEGFEGKQQALSDVDSEVEESIESSLREEED